MKTIKTKPVWFVKHKDGIGLAITAILENGETVEVKIGVWNFDVLSIGEDGEITFDADGFNEELRKFKKGWNNVARIFHCQPRIVKFNI